MKNRFNRNGIISLVKIIKESTYIKKLAEGSGWIIGDAYSYRWWGGLNDPKEIIISAILVQLSRWEQVSKAIKNLRDKGLIDHRALLRVSNKELAEALKGINFRRRKSIILKEVARKILKTDKWRILENMEKDKLVEYLMSIRGIGIETAESITLFAFNKPIVPYTRIGARVISRFLGIDNNSDLKKVYSYLNTLVNHDLYTAKLIHACIHTIAKRFCHDNNPKCSSCILNTECSYSINRSRK